MLAIFSDILTECWPTDQPHFSHFKARSISFDNLGSCSLSPLTPVTTDCFNLPSFSALMWLEKAGFQFILELSRSSEESFDVNTLPRLI